MKKKKLLWQLPFLAFLIIGTVVIVGRQKSVPYQHDEGRIFGTTYHITYQSDDNLKKEIEETLKAVDQEFSMFNPQSTVALINEGKRPTLSDDFLEVYQLAQQVNEESDGAFDITVAPLVNAWGFGFENQQMPNNHQIDSLRRLVGMEHVSLAGAKGSQYVRFQRPRMMLDFSAIAKGYGTDRVARLLMSHDVANFMVEIGGEVYAKGNSEKRLPWRIGVSKPVDDPDNDAQELETVLNVTNQAMATSGNYRNFYYKGGRKYAHTIDPKTGRPVQHSLLSATVLAPTCAEADAYATSFMVMGLDKATEGLLHLSERAGRTERLEERGTRRAQIGTRGHDDLYQTAAAAVLPGH